MAGARSRAHDRSKCLVLRNRPCFRAPDTEYFTGLKMVKRTAQVLDYMVTAFLFLFVLTQPISIAGATLAYSGAAVAWVARLGLVRKGKLQRSPLDLPILVYWLLCAISAALSPLPASSWEGMRKVGLIFLVLVVANNVRSLRRVQQLMAALFFATLVSAAYAGWQYVGGVGLRVHGPQPNSIFFRAGVRDDDVIVRVDGHLLRTPNQFLSYLNAKPRPAPVRMRVVHGGGIIVLKDAVSVLFPVQDLPQPLDHNNLGMTLETARPDRAQSFYSHYITYSMVLESIACLAFGLWLGCRGRFFSAASVGLMALTIVFALALGATLTRSAWMALAFGCLLQVWFHLRNKLIRVALPIFLLLAAVGTNAAMRRWRGMGLIDLNDQGTDYRLLMWRDGLRLAKEHPLFGVGMNTIRDSWWNYNLAAYKKYPLRSHFHSTPIQLAVEQGIPALLAWCALMAGYCLMLLRLVRRALEQEDGFSYGLALGMLGATSAFLVSSIAQYNFGDSVVVLQFWFLMGLALAVRNRLERAS